MGAAPGAVEPLIASARLAELRIADFEKFSIRPLVSVVVQEQPRPLKSLQAVDEHGAVALPEHVLAHLDDDVGPDAEHVAVIGRVMQRAHCYAVGHHRLAARLVSARMCAAPSSSRPRRRQIAHVSAWARIT